MLTGPEIVERIIDMPDPRLEEGTLTPLTAGDSFGAGATWKSLRMAANDKDLLLLVNAQVGQEHRTFQLLKQSQTVMPQPLFRWTDAAGVVWTIQHITGKNADHVFECLCLRNR